jgi:TolB protein
VSAAVGVIGTLAFTDGGDIVLMNADETGRKRITTGPDLDIHPSWSPDGTKIAFSRFILKEGADFASLTYDYIAHLFVMNADGTGLKQLTHGSVGDIRPAWSPDGTKIAFNRRPGILWLVGADGTHPVALTTVNGGADHPNWSPNGSEILFRGAFGLFLIDADGGKPRNVKPVYVAGDGLAWHPDGVRILYGSDQLGLGVYETDRSGSSTIRLVLAPSSLKAVELSWSPDGSRIAFSGSWDHLGDVFVVNSDGSGLAQITHDGKAGDPAWQPSR